jgi:hypothetical protein
MAQWDTPADEPTIEKTKAALEANGFVVYVAENREEARQKVLELIPSGVEIMTMTSVTLTETGLDKELNESGNYKPIRARLYSMDRKTQDLEMRQLGSAPHYVVGSVHAVTTDGHTLIASRTGSQLPAYAYGAGKVVWVVGTQKIVENVEAGLKRIEEYAYPLEDERARKAYGFGSEINKVLIYNKEFPATGRVSVVLVKEKLGF